MALISSPGNPFEETFGFFRRLIASPRSIGAIVPSSRHLARVMAAQIDPAASGAVLELGPGTGRITRGIIERGIAPERLWTVEYDPTFAHSIARQFPGVNVIEGNAFDLDATLGARAPRSFAAIISGLPLLNFPPTMRHALIEGVFARLEPGAPFVQFSYGMIAPVQPPRGASVRKAALVARNIPPARVWVYRKD